MSLKLTPSPTNANNGSVTWSYDVADGNLDFLADGDTLTLTYLASVDDGHGGVATAPITVTILGANDTPVITSAAAGDHRTANPSQPNPTGRRHSTPSPAR